MNGTNVSSRVLDRLTEEPMFESVMLKRAGTGEAAVGFMAASDTPFVRFEMTLTVSGA